MFRDAVPPYQEALDKSGYTHTLKYEAANDNSPIKKRNRGRRITWFNPPYSSNVSTNVGARFLKIIDKCFPPTNPLNKIINRNKVKVSYKTMPNMKEVLGRHNLEIAKGDMVQQAPAGCNCRGGVVVCPLEGSCLTAGVVYEATVTRQDSQATDTYTGLTAGRFKERYNQHQSDFRN